MIYISASLNVPEGAFAFCAGSNPTASTNFPAVFASVITVLMTTRVNTVLVKVTSCAIVMSLGSNLSST